MRIATQIAAQIAMLMFSAIGLADEPPPQSPPQPQTSTNSTTPKDTAPTSAVVEMHLNDGSVLQARQLYADDTRVIIDLAGQTVTIDRQRIARLLTEQTEPSATTHRSGIYHTGRLPKTTVDQLVSDYGDAIVIVSTPAGLGTGFMISEQGHLITNYHVVEQETAITVTTFVRQGDQLKRKELKNVKLIALQPSRDLALLQIDLEELGDISLPHVIFADSSNPIRQGDGIIAIGNPLGLERSVSRGIVSSTLRTLGNLRFIQTDASINPGNSGGPMFNERGEVVAVACAGFMFFDGLAFGIPIEDVRIFLNHQAAWLFDESQPQNGIKYLPPPGAAAPNEPTTGPQQSPQNQ
jgi:serine protease Do